MSIELSAAAIAMRHIAYRLERREVGLGVENLARDLQPVVGEDRLDLGDRRTFDPEVRVSPVIRILPMAAPLVGDADAAGESRPAVDGQELAVGPLVHPREVIPLERVVLLDLDPGGAQLLEDGGVHPAAAGPVQQHMHPDAGPGPVRERIGELLADRSGPVDVGFEGDRALGGGDRRKHGGKDLVAVLEIHDPVARQNRRPQEHPHGAQELGIRCAIAMLDALFDALLRPPEVEPEHHRDHRARNDQERPDPDSSTPLRPHTPPLTGPTGPGDGDSPAR
jgi:hypothetical protein